MLDTFRNQRQHICLDFLHILRMNPQSFLRALLYQDLSLLVLLLLDLSLTTQILTGLFTYLLGLPTTCLLALEIGNNEETKSK